MSLLQICDWLDFAADLRPGDMALVTPRVKLTYAQLRAASVAAALKLAEDGVRPGQKLAVQATNPALQFTLFLALQRLGAAACMLPQDPVRRKAGLESGLFDWLFSEEDQEISSCQVRPVSLDWLASLSLANRRMPGAFKSESDIALISISSGTMSAPKLMGFTLAQLERRIVTRGLGDQGCPRGAKVMILAGLGAMNGALALLGTLWCGGTAYIGWTPERALKVMARDQIERLFSSVAHLTQMVRAVENDALDMSWLSQVHVGGDFLSPRLAARVAAGMCANLTADFGTNETGRIAFRAIDPAVHRINHAGAICPWTEVQAVDEDDRVLPTGREGQLRFKSPLMIEGYLGDDQATAARFRGGWFYSDDIGWPTRDGRLVISGRARDLIRGPDGRFNPALIDHAMAGHPRLVEAAGFGVALPDASHEIWLALVEREPITDEALQAFCAEHLGARAPRRFLRLAQLPRAGTGKIMRGKLVEMAQQAGE